MHDPHDPLSPPMVLAIAYAPSQIRERLRWLLMFDRRLAQLVERASEPLFAQMRLAWWRDVLAKSATEYPKGEPLLAVLGELGTDAALIAAAKELVDAVELRVADEANKGRDERASAIACAFAKWRGADTNMAESLALAWANGDIAALTSFPRNLRPLTILAMAEMLEARRGNVRSGLRLSWHGLTGR